MNITCTPDELGLRLVLTPDNQQDIDQLNAVETGTQAVLVERSEPGQLLKLSMTLRTVRVAVAEPATASAPEVAPVEVAPPAPEPAVAFPVVTPDQPTA